MLEDFHLRVKITHFDHERIPERVVHARGAVTSSTDQLTAAVGLHRAWDRAPAVMASAVPPVLTS